MRKMKKVALLLVCTLAMGLFAGCGSSFDAGAYVKALLDNSYKNDSTGFVDMKVGTAEQASDLYEEGITTEVSATFSGATVSDELKSGYTETFKKMFSMVNYTVGEAEKQDDGSYVVTIEYQPLKVFGPAVEYYNANYEQISNDLAERMMSEEVTEQDIYDALFGCLKEGIDQAIDGEAAYGDKATTTVKVSIVDNTWTPNQNDLMTLETLLFDMDELNNMATN